MTLECEPRMWLERFPLGEPQPFIHDYHGLRYSGEVIRADSWSPPWGDPLREELVAFIRQMLA